MRLFVHNTSTEDRLYSGLREPSSLCPVRGAPDPGLPIAGSLSLLPILLSVLCTRYLYRVHLSRESTTTDILFWIHHCTLAGQELPRTDSGNCVDPS